MSKTDSGRFGEEIALDFLKKAGYKILEKNFYSRYGEIDIIAKKGSCLVFVEVKTRWSRQFGLPEEAITKRKLDSIRKTALYYRSVKKDLPEEERIDVVAIEMEEGVVKRIELITNAG